MLGPALLLVIAAAYLVEQQRMGAFFLDFEGTIIGPLRDVLAGRSPYPAPEYSAVDIGNPSVYPPASFLLALPLAALPFEIAAALWTFGLGLSAALALWLLGVRDRRCYLLALTSLPVLHGIVFGNLTIALLLGAAAAWRWRERVWIAGVVVGVSIALKLFLWPLLLWLLITRRFRATAIAGGTVAATLVGGWTAIKFEGVSEYPELLATLTDVFGAHSMSLFGVFTAVGLEPPVAQALLLVLALGLVASCLLGTSATRDVRGFALAVLAALIAAPIAWPHYYSLVVVLLPLVSVSLSWPWIVLPATWAAAFLLPYEQTTAVSCCRPADVPDKVWEGLHGPTPVWRAAGFVSLAMVVVASVLRSRMAKESLS